MGIGTVLLKGAKYILKAPLKNSENIAKARKAVKGSIFSTAKRQAGWQAFKEDVKATKVESSFGKSLKKIGSTLLKPFKMAGKAVKKCFQKGGLKVVGKWLGKVGKGALKCLKGIPILGTVIAIGCEIPGIVKSFKEGGFWKGMAHIGLSAAKICIASVASIAATAVGGPIAGGAAYLAVDAGLSFLQDKVMDCIPNKKAPQQTPEQDLEQDEQFVDNQSENQTACAQSQTVTVNEGSADTQSSTTSSSTSATSQIKLTGSTQMPYMPQFNFSSLNNPFGGMFPQFQPFIPGANLGTNSGLGFGTGLGVGGGFNLGFGNYQNPYALNLKF